MKSERSKIERLTDLGFGSDAEIEKASAEQIRADLRHAGIETDTNWAELQRTIKIAEGKARLAQAKDRREKKSSADHFMQAVVETKEALIEQIKGLISLSGNTAVYARKWEESSLEDLKSLRDVLARTAARAAQKKRDENR